jgi:RimJ/RimL family protein N-acetyltransferase
VDAFLPVLAGGERIGRLVPVTPAVAARADVIEALCRWRRTYATKFLTVFTPDAARTRSYLFDFSLPDPARILFVIEGPPGRLVGNIGLCGIQEAEAELDNVIRGEAANSADFMVHVQRALLRWAFHQLDVQRIHLNVLADNERAIRSYRKAGFTKVSRRPLRRQTTAEGYRLVAGPDADGEATDLELVRMQIDRVCFGPCRA